MANEFIVRNGFISRDTSFVEGTLNVTTVSATTYQNLPTDIRVTGGTYSNNNFTFTNNTGSTFSINNVNTMTGLTVNGNLFGSSVSGLSVSGVYVSPYVIVGTTYTATTTNSTIEVSGGTFTITLYTAVNNIGRTLYIKNSGNGIITVDANASETIDGQLTRTLSNDESLLLQSNGSNWVMLNASPIQLTLSHAGTSLSNTTTYFIGQDFSAGALPTTFNDSRRVVCLKSGWITRIFHTATWGGNDTGNNTLIIRNITSGTSSTLTSTLKYNSTLPQNLLADYSTFTPLQVTRGDGIYIELQTPTFTSAPTALRQTFNILIE